MTETPEPEPFRRWFDIALLIGREDRACDIMLETPQIAPTFPARIFCLARSGDWNAAALSLRTGETLGLHRCRDGSASGTFPRPRTL